MGGPGLPRLVAGAVCAAIVAGCGESHSPGADEMPLAPSLRVVIGQEVCPMTPQDCSREATIEGPPGTTEPAMMAAERRTLARRGWQPVAAADPGFVGAESPNKSVDVFLATQARWLQNERQQGLLGQALPYPDLRNVAHRALINRRGGRQALVATLELGSEPWPKLQELTGAP